MQDLKKLNYLLRICVEAREPKTSHLLNEITSLQDINRSLNTSANELLNNEDDLRVENMQLWAEVLQLETTLEEKELAIRKLRITVREQRELASDLEHSLMVALDELHHQKKQRHKETKRKTSPTKTRKELKQKDPLSVVQNAKEEREKMEQCLEDERDRLRCAVCHDEDRRILLLPCKHFVLCGKCWGGVSRRVRRTCPICNSTVTDAMTIFLS
ncbi:Zinc ion binding [Branchiostoma belcheri]|nr:Zinc ion binding [Branchiostoma belcheri]